MALSRYEKNGLAISLVIITLVATLFPMLVLSESRYYVEYKNTLPFTDDNLLNNRIVNDLRFGAKWKHIYFEMGESEFDGEFGLGWEGGYKFKRGNWELKGKWEGRDKGPLSHKIETEIRYYF